MIFQVPRYKSGCSQSILPVRRSALLVLAAVFITWTSVAAGVDFPASSQIFLIDNQGNELSIGTVRFNRAAGTDQSKSTALAVEIESPEFTDHFLSMRPFKCLQGEAEWFCYLTYPYELRNLVSTDDLSDLEYQLLFIRKKPSEFGIDAWNGLYYKLALHGNGLITGELMEGDLNSLQSPPAEPYAKPIDLSEFIEAEKSKRLYPVIELRPVN